jgi:hypothetical protein
MDYFLGTDFKLTEDGDIAIKDGDIDILSGSDCLVANLNDRILADKGELILHPEFGAGLLAKVSTPMNDEKVNALVVELRHELLAEPRIAEVLSIEETLLDRYLYLHATIKTITNQIIGNLVFPFELEAL